MNLQLSLLDNGAVFHYQRKIYDRVHATIVECWKQLNDGNISAKELLKRCDKVNYPIKYDVVCVKCPVNVLIVYNI